MEETNLDADTLGPILHIALDRMHVMLDKIEIIANRIDAISRTVPSSFPTNNSAEKIERKTSSPRHSYRWGACEWPNCKRGKMKCAPYCYDHQGSEARLQAYAQAASEQCKWKTPTTVCRAKRLFGDSYCSAHRNLANKRAKKGEK